MLCDYSYYNFQGQSKAQNPIEYCENLMLSIEPTSTSDQNYTVVYVPFSVDQHQQGKNH